MLVAHARRPFTGERKIVVAMGKMMHGDDVAPAPNSKPTTGE